MVYKLRVSYYRVYIICHRYVSFWPPLYTALYSPRSSISPLIYFIYITKYFIYHMYYILHISCYKVYIIDIFLFACRPAQLYTPQSSISTLIYFIYIPKYFIYHMYYISSVSYYRVYIICHRYIYFCPPLYTALYSPRSSISPLTPHVPSRQGLNTTTFLLYPGPALQLSLSHSFSKIFQSNKQIDMYRAPVA